MTAVSQHQTGLLGIEWNFFLCLIYMTIIFIHQSCNRFSMKNRLFKNFFAVFQFYFQIQIVIRFNTNQRPHLTKSMTSTHLKPHMSNLFTDFNCNMIHIGSQLFQTGIDFIRTTCQTSCSSTDQNTAVFFLPLFLTLFSP